MNAWLGVVTVVSCLAMLSANLAAAEETEAGLPSFTNKILSNFETPTVKPGRSADVSFEVNNPYNEPMENITLTVGVYRYVTQDESEPIDSSFPSPPLIDGNSTEEVKQMGMLPVGGESPVFIDFVTTKKTPHGSYFSQSTYFVRLNLTFTMGNNGTIVLKSRGYFTDEQWNKIVSWESGEPIVNRTYLSETLGADGLIPDTSFGIKVPIPRWPLVVIIVVAVAMSFMGLFYYVMDNPGKHPKLEKRFYYLRGKLSEFRGQPKNGRRK